MRSMVSAVVGGVLAFVAALLAIGAAVLLATGVGGGILVRERPWTARVLNYDPSDVVLRAVATGAAAFFLALVYVGIYWRLRRRERTGTQS